MNSITKEVKERLNNYGLDIFADGDCNAPMTWLGELFVHGTKPNGDKGKEIIKWLEEDYNFEHVAFDKSDDYEFAYTIISLKGKLFKLELQLNSDEDISAYTDAWDWKAVTASTKTVKSYE